MMKHNFLAALFWPRINFWLIFGSRPDPKIETFGLPARVIVLTVFTTAPKRVRIALWRPRERPRGRPGTLQGHREAEPRLLRGVGIGGRGGFWGVGEQWVWFLDPACSEGLI